MLQGGRERNTARERHRTERFLWYLHLSKVKYLDFCFGIALVRPYDHTWSKASNKVSLKPKRPDFWAGGTQSMQNEGPWCIVSQLIRVRSEETMSKERAGRRRKEEQEGEGGGTQQWVLVTAGYNILGLYSVQMMGKRQTYCEMQEQHFHQREREREPSNSTWDRQTYRVLSMYSVHRIDPQCVLTNIPQLPPDWFMSVGEARSVPPTSPRPQALKPQHRRGAGVFPGGCTFACSNKKQTLYRWIEGERVQLGTGGWAVRRGRSERRRRRSYTIKLEVFG